MTTALVTFYALAGLALAVFALWTFALEEEPEDRPLWIAITLACSICWVLVVPGALLTYWLSERNVKRRWSR